VQFGTEGCDGANIIESVEICLMCQFLRSEACLRFESGHLQHHLSTCGKLRMLCAKLAMRLGSVLN
jgi:hypothetical protein